MPAVATARLGRVACQAPLAALLRQRLQDCLLAGAVLEALQAESWPDMIICKNCCCGRLSAGWNPQVPCLGKVSTGFEDLPQRLAVP